MVECLTEPTYRYVCFVMIEQFKTLGFVVKRGLIPRETLQPWVEKLWQTVGRDGHSEPATPSLVAASKVSPVSTL